MVNAFRASLLTLSVFLTSASLPGQTSGSPKDNSTAPGLRKLTGDDEKRAKQLDEQIEAALKADRWDEAIAKTEDSLALRLKVQGPKHYETVNTDWRLKALRRLARMPKGDRDSYESVRSMQEQANAYSALGKYALAQPLFEKALATRRHLLTDDHPDTAASYALLALNLISQQKPAEAHTLLAKALAIHQRLLADDHPDTAVIYDLLATSLLDQGKYAQALPLLMQVLEMRRRLVTEEHGDTATAYCNLGYTLNGLGKFAEAQPLCEKALAIYRRVLGDEDPHTAIAYGNLAMNLNGQGKYAAAQPLYERSLEIQRRVATDNHPDTASSYNNLAYCLNAQGKYVAAQPLFEKALQIRRRLLTDDHPDTATSYNNLAYNLSEQGKYAAAEPVFEKALAIQRSLLTDDHPSTANTYNNLAGNLFHQGNYAHAQTLYEKALAIQRRLLADDHPSTANSYNNVATSLRMQGKYAQAQPLYAKALAIRRRLLTDDHPLTAITYCNLGMNLKAQGTYDQARAMFEKALEIDRKLLSDDHPNTADGYDGLAGNFYAQGKYAQAQPLYEKALEIRRRLLTDAHPLTAASYGSLATNLNAQGMYNEARGRWMSAARSLEAARLGLAFAGLERAGIARSIRPNLAAVLARLGQPAEAWQALEEDLGRGLLDELAARQDTRIGAHERERIRELIAELDHLDKLAESTPKDLDQAARAKQFDELKHQRELASIALGEFQSKLVEEYGALAGRVAGLVDIQAVLPPDTVLVAWVDIPPAGPSAADPGGEHWGVVLRSRGVPAWIPIAGTSPNGLWTSEDMGLSARLRADLRKRPSTGASDVHALAKTLRTQRLDPLAKALAATADGQPPAGRLIVLPSRAMAGIPVEALLDQDDKRTISYTPSATLFKYLRDRARAARQAGLLALGDPVYERHDKSSDPGPLPDHGLLVRVVIPGSNAATHGVKPADVLLSYNGAVLKKKEDLKVVAEGDKPAVVEVWRDGHSSRRELAPDKLGVVLDPWPAPEAIAANRALRKVLVAARGGDDDFAPLPGTRDEVGALGRLFQADDRPTRVLLATDASEPELNRIAATGELGHYGFIHLATHGVIDEDIPTRSALILTQTNLPDPLEQMLNHKPVFDGRLSVREIQRTWELKAELVTLSACETALGREAGGEGFVGFTQALLMSGARSLCLSLWKVDDTATALLMTRFYQNMLGKRPGLSKPMPKAEALGEAKKWLRELTTEEAGAAESKLPQASRGDVRRRVVMPVSIHPYEHPHFWAAFVLVGDPD
jgi:tetratricopeptide (TPR) repeat protein